MNRAKHPDDVSSLRILLKPGPLLLLFFCALNSACTTTSPPPGTSARSVSEQQFLTTVKPLVESRCSWCHSDGNPQGGLNFQDRDAIFNSSRPFLKPGSPDTSLIYLALTRPKRHPQVMPGDGWGIAESQLKAVRKWIESGAEWPDGKEGMIRRTAYKVVMDDYL
ncbi:MAG: c-type cytochrome domain-containing protein [Verrucomicrobiales bacterium]|nr:hypothetical protein [Verrucomicrobiae bacterium]